MYPDIKVKVDIVKNVVELAHAFGVACPKVAALAAVEVVNPDMPPTIDAALLTQMNRRGQIKGCVIDGPLALDNAVSPHSAEHKASSPKSRATRTSSTCRTSRPETSSRSR